MESSPHAHGERVDPPATNPADEDISEATTGEYRLIVEGADATSDPAKRTAPPHASDTGTAVFWLTHLEAEVGRLHAKWHSIDAEFKAREARIVELQDALATRDTSVAAANVRLGEVSDSLRAAEALIEAKDAEVAASVAARQGIEREVGEIKAVVAAAADEHRALESKLNASQDEVRRLDGDLAREREALAGVVGQNEKLLADQRGLQGKLQDLEGYINGRQRIWSTLNSELVDHKTALADTEKAVQTRDATIARHDEEKQRLATQILDLERQCSELTGRRKEREAAHEELQKKLNAHFEATEQLKADFAQRAKDAERALAVAADNEKLVAVLRGDVARRDEELAAARAQIGRHEASASELAATSAAAAARTAELEKSLGERTHEVAALQQERAKLESRSAEIERTRAEALAEAAQLAKQLAAAQAAVTTLESEVRAQRVTADLLERNVGRITDLGASLAALDREMDGSSSEDGAASSDSAASGSSYRKGSAGKRRELLPIDVLFKGTSERAHPLRVAAGASTEASRKLVILVDGEGIDYPLIKSEMTIGRGQYSDIRIASHFVSRTHAKVITNGIATVIEDAGSKNGILVNSERVQRRVLRDGDIVSLGGELNLRFVDAAP